MALVFIETLLNQAVVAQLRKSRDLIPAFLCGSACINSELAS
jgi:hypothetical protein